MWIADKNLQLLINTDNVAAFYVKDGQTEIVFTNGDDFILPWDTIIPTVAAGITQDSKVIYVGGDIDV